MARALEKEIKQTKPFRNPQEETFLTLVRTAAELELRMAQGLKPFGLTVTQYNVLRILRGAGDDGLCRNEVGTRLVRSVPDVTRLLDRMEEADLIVRERGNADRRYVSTRLTKKGLELVNTLDNEMERLLGETLGHMSQKRLHELRDLLREARGES